jgi:hypothetical protein
MAEVVGGVGGSRISSISRYSSIDVEPRPASGRTPEDAVKEARAFIRKMAKLYRVPESVVLHFLEKFNSIDEALAASRIVDEVAREQKKDIVIVFMAMIISGGRADKPKLISDISKNEGKIKEYLNAIGRTPSASGYVFSLYDAHRASRITAAGGDIAQTLNDIYHIADDLKKTPGVDMNIFEAMRFVEHCIDTDITKTESNVIALRDQFIDFSKKFKQPFSAIWFFYDKVFSGKTTGAPTEDDIKAEIGEYAETIKTANALFSKKGNEIPLFYILKFIFDSKLAVSTLAPARRAPSAAETGASRQRSTFSDIRYNTFANDDLFSILPGYYRDGERSMGIYAGTSINPLIYARQFRSLGGFAVKVGAGVNPLLGGYYEWRETRGEDDKPEWVDNGGHWGAGVNASAEILSPMYELGDRTKFYFQMPLDMNYYYMGNSDRQTASLDVNSLGVNFDRVSVPWTDMWFDFASKLRMKVSLLDPKSETGQRGMEAYREMIGAADLRSERLQALWLTTSLGIRWDDLPNYVPNNALITYIDDLLSRKYFIRGTFNNKVGTSVSLEYGDVEEDTASLNIYFGQRLYENEHVSVALNAGVLDFLDKERKSFFAGVDGGGEYGGVVFNANVGFYLNNVMFGRGELLPGEVHYDQNWANLTKNTGMGTEQITADFDLGTGTMTVGENDEVYLVVGTVNPDPDHGDGVVFRRPASDGGGFLSADRNVPVTIEEVTVYDLTSRRDVTSEVVNIENLIRSSAVDISSGNARAVPARLPIGARQGRVSYRIFVKLTTNTADFASPPARPVCRVRIQVRRVPRPPQRE